MQIFPPMDAEERFHNKRLGYFNNNVPREKTRDRQETSVDGIVIRTYANGALKYDKYQNIEAEIEITMDKWMTKNSSQRL